MCYTSDYNFIIKDTDQNQPKQETHRAGSRGVLKAELPCPLPAEPGHVTYLAHLCSPTRKLHQTLGFRVLSGFIAGMINRIAGHVTEVHLQPCSFHRRLGLCPFELLPQNTTDQVAYKQPARISHPSGGWEVRDHDASRSGVC